MTIDASALIVGIDTYDNGQITPLDGCVNDARDAVEWLIEIGVDVKRIAIHTSPTDLKTFPAGATLKPATDKSIRASLKALAKGRGEQLFLFFSGHGKFVTGAGPIFLCQDYYVDESPRENLAIREYIEWFRSWDYRDQFLFYDACQDATASVGQISTVEPSGPDAAPGTYKANPKAALTACYACSDGETAWAGDGRGVLVRNVLAALDTTSWADLDPDAPEQDAIEYDWTTGARFVDLDRLFTNTIAQKIRSAANAAGKYQTPFCEPHGRALKDGWSPILELPLLGTVNVTVAVDPERAFGDIKSITLRSQKILKPCFLPYRNMPLEVPTRLKFPLPDQLNARCRLAVGSTWQTSNIPLDMQLVVRDVDVVLQFQQPPRASPPTKDGTGEVNLTIDGGPRSLPPEILAEIQSGAGNVPSGTSSGLAFGTDESGAVIRLETIDSRSIRKANDIAVGWLKAARRFNRDSTSRVMLSPVDHPRQITPNTYFYFGDSSAAEIAGYIEDDECVSIETLADELPPRKLSLRDLEAHPHEFLEPGQSRVSIDLPWGRWTQRFRTGEKLAFVEMPPAIGLEPLRNRYRRSDSFDGMILLPPLSAVATPVHVIASDPGNRIWGVAAMPFPMLAHVSEQGLRVEPFSETSLREWDDLLTVGRLDIDDAAGLVERLGGRLPGGTIEEFALFALAAAYSELNRRNWAGLRTIIEALEDLPFRPLDLALVKIALEIEDGVLIGEQRQHAIAAALSDASTGIPVLRWGTRLLLDLVDRADLAPPPWITAVDPTSVAAILHEPGLEALGFDLNALFSEVHRRKARSFEKPSEQEVIAQEAAPEHAEELGYDQMQIPASETWPMLLEGPKETDTEAEDDERQQMREND